MLAHLLVGQRRVRTIACFPVSSEAAMNVSDTLVLTRRDIAGLMRQEDYFRAAEIAFCALASGEAVAPLPLHLHGDGGAFHVKGASLNGDRHLAAIKLNGNFPGNAETLGLPTIQGAILLADATNGSLLAVMDSIEITLQRTAAASALAARHLARPGSSRVAVCGCGEQGRVQLAALASAFSLEDVSAWDRDFGRARAYADEIGRRLAVTVRATERLEAATSLADIIVTCTTARAWFLGTAHVRPGTFIAAIGADNAEKSEIAPELMSRSKIVVDVLDQCLAMGDLHHAVGAGAVTAADVCADLGQIVNGKSGGRRNDDEIWIFDSTGTAAQDVACAAEVYARALAGNVGIRVRFGIPAKFDEEKWCEA
jgi:ornithine cyclodeaminase/alanine dehydrogenase-like protein (mu-crystallin family)